MLSLPLRQAWLKRWNQDLEGALIAFSEIQATRLERDLSPECLTAGMKPADFEYTLELALLRASIQRAQGNLVGSSAAIVGLQQRCQALGRPEPYRLALELGHCRWLALDASAALEHYVLARSLAREPIEKLFALSNALACLESLGLKRDRIEAECQELIGELSRKDATEVRHPIEQWDAYLMRRDFFRGDVASALVRAKNSGQGAFLAQWISSLPYIHASQKNHDSSELLKPGYLWQGGYRARTLLGVLALEDASTPRLADRIDRLYLWVWRWMTDLTPISPEKVKEALAAVLTDARLDQESAENRLLLRNALSWIALLQPSLESLLEPTLARVRRTPAESYPLLAFEHAVAMHLAQPDLTTEGAQDQLKVLKDHPLWKSEQVLLAQLADGRQTCLALQGLVLKLRSAQTSVSELSRTRVRVDLALNQVQIGSTGAILRSQPLAQALAWLSTHSSTPAQDLMRCAFSIPRYDSAIHARKIYNLIARIKTISGDRVRPSMKNDVVVTAGSWAWLEVKQPDELALAFGRGSPIAEPTSTEAPSAQRGVTSPAVLIDHLGGAREFRREDVERVLGHSRASACRQIKRWLKAGKIVARGKARATLYRLSNDPSDLSEESL